MRCERCEHTIATDSPVWCQECHDARIAAMQEEYGAQLDALREVEYAGRELAAWKRRWESASQACNEARKERDRAAVALSLVSGALMDASTVVVPADPARYGDAVRELARERDAARASAAGYVARDDRLSALLDGEPESVAPAPLASRLEAFVARLRRERDAALVEVARLRAALAVAGGSP
jgi:hypothetical protein